MTRLSKPVSRVVEIGHLDRVAITVRLDRETIGFRPYRSRTEFLLPLSHVYQMAVEATLAVRQARTRARAMRGQLRRRK